MHILLTGATGLIGQQLLKQLGQQHSFTLLVRDKFKAEETLSPLCASPLKLIRSIDELAPQAAIDAVINLAGEPIADKRWSAKQKHRICHSRWDLTEKLVNWITENDNKPQVLISGSAVGYYGRQGDTLVTESLNDCFDEFSHQVCKRWESLANKAISHGVRTCLLRTGVVLSSNGGALAKMLPAFRFGLGGPIGSGKQFMPWIHLHDMVSAIEFLLHHKQARGPFNLTAPYPVTNLQFSQQLAKQLKRPCILPMPSFAMRLLFGEMADLLLYGQKAVPSKLGELGFEFHYPHLENALEQLFPRG